MNRLTLRIAITLYLLLGLFVGGVGYYVKNHLEKETSTLLESSMGSITRVISEDVSGVYIDYLLAAKRGGDYSREIAARLSRYASHFKLSKIILCDTSLAVLATTDSTSSAGKHFIALLHIDNKLNILRAGRTVSTPVYLSEDRHLMSVYIPIKGEDDIFKAVLAVEASAEFFSLLIRFERFFIYTGIVFAVLLFFGAWFISRQLTKPIRDMADAAMRIGNGEVGTTVELPVFRDEIRSLALSINTMSKQLSVENRKNMERMEGLRILAAGVAHEVRNPMQGISLYTDRLRRNGTNTETMEIADKIKSEIRQIELIVTELLDYTRDINLTYSTFPVQELVREALSANGVHGSITGHYKAVASGDRVRLRQVLVNIIRNGCEASGEELPKIAVHIYKPGNNYKIEIHNSGKQIDNETMQKIFQPFFTTKAKGSGLGLAICKKIMEAHKGSILIGKSGKEGYATCVTVEWVPKEPIYGQNIDS